MTSDPTVLVYEYGTRRHLLKPGGLRNQGMVSLACGRTVNDFGKAGTGLVSSVSCRRCQRTLHYAEAAGGDVAYQWCPGTVL